MENKLKECFVIMPIADAEGYAPGHFKHVYDNIIAPACEKAKYRAIRADEVKQTNLIHLDILKKIIESPIAICDLSNRNPNVLFELGIRQAFDKPVVLIQEEGTPRIFDITPLRYLEYSREMRYHDVLKSQEDLKIAIEATISADGKPGNVNSIVKLLALNNSAQIPDIENGKDKLMSDFLIAEMREMRKIFEYSMLENRKLGKNLSISAIEYERITNTVDRILNTKNLNFDEREMRLHDLLRETEEIMMNSKDEVEHIHFKNLMRRIHQSMKRR